MAPEDWTVPLWKEQGGDPFQTKRNIVVNDKVKCLWPHHVFSSIVKKSLYNYILSEIVLQIWQEGDITWNPHPTLKICPCCQNKLHKSMTAHRRRCSSKHQPAETHVTRCNLVHAKIKWYAAAREPFQWKQNQGISMFQLRLNQGYPCSLVLVSLSGTEATQHSSIDVYVVIFPFRKDSLAMLLSLQLVSQAKENISCSRWSCCAKTQERELLWHCLW